MARIKGVIYEEVKCAICKQTFKTNEGNKNGISEEDVEFFKVSKMECNVNDLVCMNCTLEACDEQI